MAPKRRAKPEQTASKKSRTSLSSDSEEEFESQSVKTSNGNEIDVPESSDQFPKADDIIGRLLVCGGTNWDLIGRKELPKQAKNAENVSNAVSGCTACHSLIVTDDGKVLTWGRNDRGQLGHGDTVRRDEPTIVEALKDYQIVGGAVGRGHTLFLTSKGTVFACGDNKMGQLGVGSQLQTILAPTRVAHKGKPIVKVACGAEFSLIVDCAGHLFSFGFPQYGQLGHNTEAKYFASGNKLAYKCEYSPRKVMLFIEKNRDGHTTPVEDVKIVDIACGINHSLAIDDKKRCYSWGFGGYGRLGHSETKDEMMPRLIKTFDSLNRGVKGIWCGGTFSMAVDVHNLLYFWGLSKTSGEATMYPKNVQDLNGWNIRSIGCANRSIVVAADDSVISWGPSPTYGELGYGENKSKSSTIPQEVKPLEGIYIHKVSTGYGHTLMIARNQSEQEKKLIDNLPKWP
ncbi:Protein RCC2 -like protein [Sarcoptes scabiei]|nr:Protein RCC2 -like protein [Sarcoptes scabiei]